MFDVWQRERPAVPVNARNFWKWRRKQSGRFVSTHGGALIMEISFFSARPSNNIRYPLIPTPCVTRNRVSSQDFAWDSNGYLDLWLWEYMELRRLLAKQEVCAVFRWS